MKLAIIGLGTMGTTHARQIAAMEDAELVGVCDRNSARAEQAAARYGTRAYTSLKEMIGKENPDAVHVCLPTFLHKEAVLEIASFGKHVICEKPIALHLQDAREMIDACNRQGVRLFIGHVVRFFPNYADLAGKVRSRLLGAPGVAHLKRYGGYPRGIDNWYRDANKSGGVILDLMIHDIDFVRWVYGEAESVYALKADDAENMLQVAHVTLQFANKAIANLSAFWGYAGEFTTAAEFAGDQGVAILDSAAAPSLSIRRQATEEAPNVRVQVPSSPLIHEPYYGEIRHFLECIRTGKEPIVTAEDAYRALEIALAAEASAQTGKPVFLGGERV